VKKQNRKLMIHAMSKWICFYCNKEIMTKEDATVDHIWPKFYGGKDTLQNQVTACADCNELKDKLPPFFFMRHREELKQAYEQEREFFRGSIAV